MPFLVQRLSAEDLFVDFDISEEVMQYQLTASIARGNRGRAAQQQGKGILGTSGVNRVTAGV